jgi:hypothetical protein
VEFTVGVSLPAGANISFGGCDPTTGSCVGATVCSAPGQAGCVQPVVDRNLSFTTGPGLATPPGIPSNVFYIHVEAGPDTANPLDRARICNPNEQVELGFVTVSGLTSTEVISLTTAGLDLLGFPLIENADPTQPVDATQTTTTDLAETETVILNISPATTDVSGLTETQLTLFSDLGVTNLCIGLEAPEPILPDSTTVGDCTQQFFINKPAGDLEVRLCQAGRTPPERGPGVADGVASSVMPTSFVVRPNEPTADVLGLDLPANTTFFVMQGALPQFIPPVFSEDTVNNLSQSSLLGTHRYEDQQRAAPVVVFDGCQEILDFVGDPNATDVINVFPTGDPVSLAEISRVSTFDPQGDLDLDGVSNDDDNCLVTVNADQFDRGRSALNTVDARVKDGAGDACQCGDGQISDVAEPGSVLLSDSNEESDLDECRRAAGGDPNLDPGAQARCSVAGDFEVTAADLLLLSLALDDDDAVGPNDIEQVCQPALVPEPDNGE